MWVMNKIMKEDVIRELTESGELKKTVSENLTDLIVDAAQMIVDTYKARKKVLLIGNGGSAADAQHLATELVGRFMLERKALPAIALTTDTSVLTAVSNDYGYETVFSRQIEALAEEGDILLAMTTSAASPNILIAMETARVIGMKIILMTGERGKSLTNKAGLVLSVPSSRSPRIQEVHITIGHIICYLVEKELFGE